MTPAELFALPTRILIKAKTLLVAQGLLPAADGTTLDPALPVTAWIPGDPSERFLEIVPRVLDMFLSSITTQAIRGMFLELATDPGDAGDLSADQTPRPGFLSALGAGWYGTTRGGAEFATGFLTITNTGTTSTLAIKPFDLTFRRSTLNGAKGYPTYRNTADAAVYVGLGGTLTLAPSASATIPIVAEQIGTGPNAAPAEISVNVNGSLGTLTVTNTSPVLGAEREDRALYIARCKRAGAGIGTSDRYAYASVTGRDGLPLQLWDGSGVTTVNRTYFSKDTSTGQILGYLANLSGPASAVEVSSAIGNINGIEIPATDGTIYNPDPLNVVGDCVTLGPTITDSVTGADGPAAASATNIGPLIGTARAQSIPGLPALDMIAAAQVAMEAALSLYLAAPETAPIGGLEQVAGAGKLWRTDLAAAIRDSYAPSVGGQTGKPRLRDVLLSVPTSDAIVIALGHVPVYVGPPTVTGVGAGAAGTIRLTLSDATTFTTGKVIQLYSVLVTGIDLIGANNGIWTVININSTHVDLVGSVWVGGPVFTSVGLSGVSITVTA